MLAAYMETKLRLHKNKYKHRENGSTIFTLYNSSSIYQVPLFSDMFCFSDECRIENIPLGKKSVVFLSFV